jgi:hypothetical protein
MQFRRLLGRTNSGIHGKHGNQKKDPKQHFIEKPRTEHVRDSIAAG